MFHSVLHAEKSSGKCGESELQDRFLVDGVLFCFCFLLQFLAILTALANTNKIYFGLLFPCVFASQMCYRNSCLIVVQYLKISLNAELELFSVSLNYWSNLDWDPE